MLLHMDVSAYVHYSTDVQYEPSLYLCIYLSTYVCMYVLNWILMHNLNIKLRNVVCFVQEYIIHKYSNINIYLNLHS